MLSWSCHFSHCSQQWTVRSLYNIFQSWHGHILCWCCMLVLTDCAWMHYLDLVRFLTDELGLTCIIYIYIYKKIWFHSWYGHVLILCCHMLCVHALTIHECILLVWVDSVLTDKLGQTFIKKSSLCFFSLDMDTFFAAQSANPVSVQRLAKGRVNDINVKLYRSVCSSCGCDFWDLLFLFICCSVIFICCKWPVPWVFLLDQYAL